MRRAVAGYATAANGLLSDWSMSDSQELFSAWRHTIPRNRTETNRTKRFFPPYFPLFLLMDRSIRGNCKSIEDRIRAGKLEARSRLSRSLIALGYIYTAFLLLVTSSHGARPPIRLSGRIYPSMINPQHQSIQAHPDRHQSNDRSNGRAGVVGSSWSGVPSAPRYVT